MTPAAQTGLSCSALLPARVLRPIPRRDPRRAPALASRMWPSPRHDRLGSRVVSLSRLQASLDVAARVLAPRCAARAASRALDAPLGTRGSLARRLGPATRRSGAYRDGTCTRWRSAAGDFEPRLLRGLSLGRVTTHHAGVLASASHPQTAMDCGSRQWLPAPPPNPPNPPPAPPRPPPRVRWQYLPPRGDAVHVSPIGHSAFELQS